MDFTRLHCFMHIFNQEISMKKSVAFLSFAAIAINAYAADERDASRIAKKYSEAVACQLEGIFARGRSISVAWGPFLLFIGKGMWVVREAVARLSPTSLL